jgi:integrase
MLDEDDQRPPRQLSWKAQREHLHDLPAHLARMALFDLNTGLRDEPLCNLRWEWEVRLEDLGFSVFVVPKRYVKGRKADRVVVCNTVAQSIIESARGMHADSVFVYSQRVKKPKYGPIGTMNNTAWQNGGSAAGLATSGRTTCGTRSACGCVRRASPRRRARTSSGTRARG